MPKNDCGLDLAIAISILSSSYKSKLGESLFVGELGLDGEIKSVNGIVGKLLKAREKGIKRAFVPYSSVKQAQLVPGIELYALKTLNEAAKALQGSPLNLIKQKL